MVSFIEIKELTKRFGKNKVLSGVSLNLDKGDIMGIVGKSGCGKSTLLKILVGYHSADSGQILFEGNDVTRRSRRIRSLVGYTTQDNSFYEKLTVYENMVYYANLYGFSAEDKKGYLNGILTSVGLHGSKNTLAGDISGGMKRRLDFAISLIHNPHLLILDEPTTGLDFLLIEQFWRAIMTRQS